MKKSVMLSVIIFIALFITGIAFVYFKEQKKISSLRKVVTEVAAGQAYAISRQLDHSLSATFALASLLQQYGEISNFSELAEDMIDRYGGISSLQLAPNGVVRQIWPLEGNESAIGHDLLGDPSRRAEAMAAVKSRKLTLAGPLTLIQGGVAVIGRYPVFLADKKSGEDTFWGFTIALIRLPELLEKSNINQLVENGYHYELSRYRTDKNEAFVFAQSNHEVIHNPVTIDMEIPNSQWRLSIAPRSGWLSPLHKSHEVLIIILIAAAISLLFYQRVKNISEISRANQLLTREISERKRLEQELKALSLTDELTGLYNRRGFFTMAEHHLKIARRENISPILLFADVDYLKEVNDLLGHHAGDLLLVEISDIFKSIFREEDIIARIGGDEFVVLIEAGGDSADAISERLQKKLDEHNAKRDSSRMLSVSTGIVEYNPQSMSSVNELLSQADKLMYEQKVLKKQI